MTDKQVKKVSCGEFHSLCLLSDGSVHSWGGSLHKQLGKRENSPLINRNPNTPNLIEGLLGKHIIDIDCGDHHSMALDGSGKVYSWGGGGTKFNKG